VCSLEGSAQRCGHVEVADLVARRVAVDANQAPVSNVIR
jgi:hypothetical protein